MAVTFQKQQAKQKYLILIFLIVISIILLVLYFGIFKKQNPSLFPESYQPLEPSVPKINFEALKNPFLKELLPFEEIKPFENRVGRENPFEPY